MGSYESGFKIIGWVFTLVAIGLLAAGAIVYRHTERFIERALVAEGSVVELERRESVYHPVVSFRANDGKTVTFSSSIGSRPPSYRKGEKVRVLYDSLNPEDATIAGVFSLWFPVMILGGIGAVFFLIGGSFIGFSLRRKRIEAWLRQSGQIVTARFHSVVPATHIRTMRGRIYHVVRAMWNDPVSGREYIFQSKPIPWDPTDFAKGKDIPVFIDPQRPERHLVDTSFLPVGPES
ncbi:MAG: DUF3592 domain-containing protein [Deltaproteobacteria bacterium CG_4_8_14_3_um_filter_51_11]|nr:MAG: DUF3592 domain-containing protein [Deltaproteobacteria bacterium CG_4_8_14_3_um_filter_51_11]